MKKRKLGRGLIPPSLKKIANGLGVPGEAGRSIPGGIRQVLSEQKQKAVAAIPSAGGRTEISTYLTKSGGSFQIYEATSWVKIRFTLLTAGPVDVGTREEISPVLSGKGGSLIPNETFEFEVKKGERVFITAGSVNRVRFTVSPVPFGTQILKLLSSILGGK